MTRNGVTIPKDLAKDRRHVAVVLFAVLFGIMWAPFPSHAQDQNLVPPASEPADPLAANLRAAKLQQSVAVADFNGDGTMDVAVADFLSDNILVMLGDGEGHFGLAAKLPSSSGPRSIVAADFNHDGLTDLASANFFSGDVLIFISRGDGTFEEPRSLHLEKGLASMVSADFDADGIPDLAVANFFSGQVAILKGAGDSTFEVRSPVGPTRAHHFSIAATSTVMVFKICWLSTLQAKRRG